MWFRKKKPQVVEAPIEPAKPRVYEVEVKNPDKALKEYLVQIQLRRGMWVKDDVHGVGIVTDAKPDDNVVFVMLVDEKGHNKSLVAFDPFALRQAGLNDIPEPRRPHPDTGRAKGYV